MKLKKVQFEVDPKKYFEVDPEKLEKVQEGDSVLVTIDFENEKAEYIWYGNNESPANFPAEEDDFDGVVQLWEELGKPGSETEKVMTAKEAEERWGFSDGFVRQSIQRGKLKKHLDSGHIRKSAGTWLVTEEIMREVYGEPK